MAVGISAGPRPAPTHGSLDLADFSEDRAERCLEFVETFCFVTKGVGAKKKIRLRDWQQDLIFGTFSPGVRTALWSMPRGQGKSTLAACIGLFGIFADGIEGANVYVVATDERQSRLVWNIARRMVEVSSELSSRVKIYTDRIYIPETDSTFSPLPAKASALYGLDPTLTIVDELHVVDEATWNAMASAGKREEAVTLAISTPGTDRDSVMWRLTEAGRRGDDPSFYFREFAAPEDADADDEDAWHEANPALGDFLSLAALRASRRSMREASFRQLRMGIWNSGESAWLGWGDWAACAAPRRIEPGARIVLGFDGSASEDATALIAATCDPEPYVWVAGLWERPEDAPGWRVPRSEVSAVVEALCDRHDVAELAADPFHWRSEIEQWGQTLPTEVTEWPTHTPSRMAPATDRVRALVVEERLAHDGDERLAAHVTNATAKTTAVGDVITKDKRGSQRKIDACIAMIIAVDRAAFYASKKKKRRRVLIA